MLNNEQEPVKKQGRPPKVVTEDTMVLVKFNCTTTVHMIPDTKYAKECETLESMRYEQHRDYQQRLAAGTPYELKGFALGEVGLIPSWYYKAHKNDTVKISVHIPRMTDKQGQLTPFDSADAIRFGMTESQDTMVTLKRFVKVKDVE